MLFGAPAAAPVAALANGTLAHCLDFDDTYVRAVTHTSAPVWAATLALGEEIGAAEDAMLAAFVTGFEVASRIGDGLGEAVTARGWHGTGVFGRLGAAAAAAALAAARRRAGIERARRRRDADRRADRLVRHDGEAVPCRQARRWTGSSRRSSPPPALPPRPACSSRAAGSTTRWCRTAPPRLAPVDFAGWNILDNSFKPYAACHLTHPAIDAARALRPRSSASPPRSAPIRAEIGALAMQITGGKSGAPETPLEGKFDLNYCDRAGAAWARRLGRRFSRAVASGPGDLRDRAQGRGRGQPRRWGLPRPG